jgi:hypothetical protein
MLPCYNLACTQPSWQDSAFFNTVASELKSVTSPKLQGDLIIPNSWLTKEIMFFHIIFVLTKKTNKMFTHFKKGKNCINRYPANVENMVNS